jgi:bacterioferritin
VRKTETKNAKSIKILNDIVALEIGATMQYSYYHFVLEDLGYKGLGEMFDKISVDEMDHIEVAAERALFLGGDIDMIPTAKLDKSKDVKKMLEKGRALEADAVALYNKMAAEARAAGDAATEDLLRKLIVTEEAHYSDFDQHIRHIETLGNAYLATLVGGK